MTKERLDLSQTISEVVQKVGASAVRVEARSRAAASGAIWSADGLVIASNHTIEREEHIEIGLGDGRTVAASLVGRDPSTDIAVLKADATGLIPVPWTDVGALQVGHLVAAVARPGRTVRAALGIVSALGDAWRTGLGGRIDQYIEPDLGLHLGFSGSLLTNLDGGVLGLNTSGLTRRVGVTIPSGTVRRSVESLLAHGRVRRGYLGVGTYPIRLTRRLEQSAGQGRGLLIVSIQEDGPAEKSGLVQGDILISLGGKPVQDVGDLIGLLDEDQIGTETSLRMIRGGQVQDAKIAVGARA